MLYLRERNYGVDVAMRKEKTIVLNSLQEAQEVKEAIINNLQVCVNMLRKEMELDAFEFFKAIKYSKTVIDPLTEEPEILIEVVNQCQTYVVSLMGAEYLFLKFPGISLKLNLGNVDGYDIESTDGSIIAECFAATSYRSNNKLSSDLKRLSDNITAENKFEFFCDKVFSSENKKYYEKKYPDIILVKFSDLR